MKLAHRIRSEVNFNGEQQVDHQKPVREGRRHVAGKSQAAEQKDGSDGVQDMVHIETIAGALLIAHAGEGAIQRISEPVQGQTGNHAKQPERVPAGEPVAGAGSHQGAEAERSQVVRINPQRQTLRHADESPFFGRCQKAGMGAPGFPEVCVWHPEEQTPDTDINGSSYL